MNWCVLMVQNDVPYVLSSKLFLYWPTNLVNNAIGEEEYPVARFILNGVVGKRLFGLFGIWNASNCFSVTLILCKFSVAEKVKWAVSSGVLQLLIFRINLAECNIHTIAGIGIGAILLEGFAYPIVQVIKDLAGRVRGVVVNHVVQREVSNKREQSSRTPWPVQSTAAI